MESGYECYYDAVSWYWQVIGLAKIDYDPLFDNQRWEDRPVKDPVIIKQKHDDGTTLERKLHKHSGDNRRVLSVLSWAVGAVILAVTVFAVIALLVWGFKYSFM